MKKLWIKLIAIFSKCSLGSWECSTHKCKKTCSVYGIGHYTTFDGHNYNLRGKNSYVLVEVSAVYTN